jgi:hypothetical protein
MTIWSVAYLVEVIITRTKIVVAVLVHSSARKEAPLRITVMKDAPSIPGIGRCLDVLGERASPTKEFHTGFMICLNGDAFNISTIAGLWSTIAGLWSVRFLMSRIRN